MYDFILMNHRPKNGCVNATQVHSGSPLPDLCVEGVLEDVEFQHDGNEGIVLLNNLVRGAPFRQKQTSLKDSNSRQQEWLTRALIGEGNLDVRLDNGDKAFNSANLKYY